VALASLAIYIWRKPRPPVRQTNDSSDPRWMAVVLLLVAITRYAVALPDILPMGVDPPIFLILAQKIQLAQHAARDWLPFDSAALNFPAGAPTLVAILSSICGLPVQVVFKDLMPMLGVLGTAQVYVFTGRATNATRAGLYAAMAYGTWVGLGSIDFYKWGGMPNEIAILLFLASLSAWLEESAGPARLAATSVLYAAAILSHHHTQLASAGVLVTAVAWMLSRAPYRRAAVMLILSVLAALALDGFFLVSYLPRIAVLGHTSALYSEWPMSFITLVLYMGTPFVLTALAGMAFCARRRFSECHPVVMCACAALLGMFVICEYLLPPLHAPPLRRHWVAFTPSHFLNDLPCFLAVYAGIAAAVVQTRLRLPTAAVMAMMLLPAVSAFDAWSAQAAGSGVSPDFVEACQWIRQNTSPDSIIRGNRWGQYLAWRRGEEFNLPDSEVNDDPHPLSQHIAMILAGTIPPDSSEMIVVEIVQTPDDSGRPVLWRSAGGLEVVQDWPN